MKGDWGRGRRKSATEEEEDGHTRGKRKCMRKNLPPGGRRKEVDGEGNLESERRMEGKRGKGTKIGSRPRRKTDIRERRRRTMKPRGERREGKNKRE